MTARRAAPTTLADVPDVDVVRGNAYSKKRSADASSVVRESAVVVVATGVIGFSSSRR